MRLVGALPKYDARQGWFPWQLTTVATPKARVHVISQGKREKNVKVTTPGPPIWTKALEPCCQPTMAIGGWCRMNESKEQLSKYLLMASTEQSKQFSRPMSIFNPLILTCMLDKEERQSSATQWTVMCSAMEKLFKSWTMNSGARSLTIWGYKETHLNPNRIVSPIETALETIMGHKGALPCQTLWQYNKGKQ